MPLPLPTNGTVTMDSNTVGSVATYSCDVGFVITGPTSRTCEPGGSWSDFEPVCEREFGHRAQTKQSGTYRTFSESVERPINFTIADKTSCLLIFMVTTE